MYSTALEIFNLLTPAIGGFLGGATVALALLKKQAEAAAQKALENITPSELLDFFNKISEAIDEHSPGGEEITDAEALALGKAVWAAAKD